MVLGRGDIHSCCTKQQDFPSAWYRSQLQKTICANGNVPQEADDWKIKSILDLRIERKRALRYRISQLQRRLDAKEEL